MSEIILQTPFWSVELAYKQYYLGRSVVILKRDCEHLSGLTQEEFLDFQKLVQALETALIKAFGATMFNWTCLKNAGYSQKSYKPLMHWHFRPRYANSFEFKGKVFKDEDFGQTYNSFGQEKKLPEVDFDEDYRQEIIKEIQKYL
jgi:diadenosine tetraphosphate (Ap4A) HIT family hydrolase